MDKRWRGAWFLLLAAFSVAKADEPPLAEYFRIETAKLKDSPLANLDPAGAWKSARPELQRQLREMLGLDPMPARGDLHARITGTIDRPDFAVEKLLFQSSPGLYVTANLYRPKQVSGRLPAILYVCGHSKVEKDGLILGCKAHYQHHANWFAANGYVCLVLDTLQLGELPGLHHGTYREGMWWWLSRGQTPAGIEAWNAIRGIDYLVSRPDVDASRIGVTGRSGGGATSWWVGAIDDRVAAVAPVAGITDLDDHVVKGVVEGHCDCMYFVNTYRWDFPTLAALVAPKPLLVVNTDSDPIFPEDGVRRIYARLEMIYSQAYNASDRLGLVVGKGGHVDTPQIRHPTFAFFEKWLKGKEGPIDEPDRMVPIEDLKVLKPGEVPPYVRNGTIHESFVDPARVPPVPESAEGWETLRTKWMAEARAKALGGWPVGKAVVPPDPREVERVTTRRGVKVVIHFMSQAGVELNLRGFHPPIRTADLDSITLVVMDRIASKSGLRELIESSQSFANPAFDRLEEPWKSMILGRVNSSRDLLAFVAPRGVGATDWPSIKDVHVRRRFALLGQTLEGMQAWDVRRAIEALGKFPDFAGKPIHLLAEGQAAPVALWAAAFEPSVASITLIHPPTTWRDGPAFLGIDRVLGMPQAAALLYPRPLTLVGTNREAWSWTSDLGRSQKPGQEWPLFLDR